MKRSDAETILIIDDDPDFVEALSKTLEAKSYQVITAFTKAEARQMIKAKPKLIILGTLAPAGQTLSMCRWIKRHASHKMTPLLVLDTPHAEQSVRGRRKSGDMQLEADARATKPIEPALLLPQIRSLLEKAAGKAAKIKVLVVDDNAMVRDGLCAVLSLQKDVEIVGEAVNGQEAIEKVRQLLPDVVLMDIVMPIMNGLEATRRINMEYPQAKVLILTQYDEEENMVVARDAGAYGFVPKRAASTELIDALRSVSQGKYFPASLAEFRLSPGVRR